MKILVKFVIEADFFSELECKKEIEHLVDELGDWKKLINFSTRKVKK